MDMEYSFVCRQNQQKCNVDRTPEMECPRDRWTREWGAGCNWYGTVPKVMPGYSATGIFWQGVNEGSFPWDEIQRDTMLKLSWFSFQTLLFASCIVRPMPPTPQTANKSVVINIHISWWVLTPHCESSRTLLCLLLPREFLVAVAIFPSWVSADLHCISRGTARRAASSAMLGGRNEAGKADHTKGLKSLRSKGRHTPELWRSG